MTKNERSLQWVIAGIFFVVCFAFFQWIYPNHLFFKEQMRIFLYTTDYFISFWDEPAWLSCYVGNFLIQFFHLTVIGPLIVTCVLLLLWYYSMRVLRKFGNGNMVSIYALFPVALEWGLICRLSYSIASTLTLIFVLWLFLGYIRIKNKRTKEKARTTTVSYSWLPHRISPSRRRQTAGYRPCYKLWEEV